MFAPIGPIAALAIFVGAIALCTLSTWAIDKRVIHLQNKEIEQIEDKATKLTTFIQSLGSKSKEELDALGHNLKDSDPYQSEKTRNT